MNYCSSVSHNTKVNGYPIDFELIYKRIEYVSYKKFVSTGYFHPKFIQQQGAKMDCGLNRTMRYSKIWKDYEYRGSVKVKRPLGILSLYKVCKRAFCEWCDLCGYLTKVSSYPFNKSVPFITEKGERSTDFILKLNTSKLIHYIANLERLIISYQNIKLIKGNLTRVINKETRDAISLDWFKKISKTLVAGQFEFKFSIGVNISKTTGQSESKWLAIALLRDKIVLRSIFDLLNEIYEPLFLPYSHGYRKKKGRYTAFEHVKKTFKGVQWIISADITSSFDFIDYSKLLEILKHQISCSKTLSLLSKWLKISYVMGEGKILEKKIGAPLRSTFSSVVSNIYLHEFDLYMDNLIKEYPEYNKLLYTLGKPVNNKDTTDILKIRRFTCKTIKKDNKYLNLVKISYIRYGWVFLVGISGPISFAKLVLKRLYKFLHVTLHLNLNQNKISITSFRKPILFLGVLISSCFTIKKYIKKIEKGKSKVTRVQVFSLITLYAPRDFLIEKMIAKKFFKWKNQTKKVVRPTARKDLVNLDHATIILFYNSVIKGLVNYYNFVDNRKSIRIFTHGLKLSCGLTLALKFKLRTLSKVFHKFGFKLKDPVSKVEFHTPSAFVRWNPFKNSRN